MRIFYKTLIFVIIIFFSLEILSRLIFYSTLKISQMLGINLPNLIVSTLHVMTKNINELRYIDQQLGLIYQHKDLGYAFKPDHAFDIVNPYGQKILYRTKDIFGDGEFGLRDDGIDKQMFAIAVGDSFTFCMHLEDKDCWVEIVESLLDLDVINTGVYGYGTYQESIMLKKVLRKLGSRSREIKYILWQITFTDYQDDSCFLEGKMCNIFSPLFIYTPVNKQSFLNYSFLIGIFFSLYDTINYLISFNEIPKEPDESVFREAQSICDEIGCKLIIIYAYRSYERPKLCRKYECIYPRYSEDMFIPGDRHLNVKGSNFLAQQIIERLK